MNSRRHVAPAQGIFARHSLRASVALGAVGILAGLMFAISASSSADDPERRPANLRDLVRVESARLEQTNTDVGALRAEVSDLLAQESDPAQADPLLMVDAGTMAVAGPGVAVQLWDAPVPVRLPDGVGPDDLVVHQQDVEAVMNGLWAGGAEAMTVQGHRVTSTSSVRCVGNVLLIDGATYSPPYEIAAIGDPERLQAAVLQSEAIGVYLEYVEALNLGWSISDVEELTMPADDSNLTMEYANVPG